ncbi:MAG: alanine racemase [Bacteroidota bacterium]|nr:alanine racemase [Bacteroidota bacterium]
MRNTFAVVDLTRLVKNYKNIRRKVKTSKVMAVIKADAYGHGAVNVAKSLCALGKAAPEYFAVALTEEAIELRKNKITTPILVLDPFSRSNAPDVIKYKLEATVYNREQLKILDNELRKSGSRSKIKIHIKIDTGMGRLGVSSDEAVDFIRYVKSNSQFVIAGIYTHFSTSDEYDKTYANLQLAKFTSLVNCLRSENIDYGLAHCANSGAILDMPDSYFDMVRPGIILYGYHPSLETSDSINLSPVMDLFSCISTVRLIRENEYVSYGRKFKAGSNVNIASVPIGYADGINRHLTNKMKVIIADKEYPQAGTVTMDRIMINLNNDVYPVSEKVILLGHSKNCSIDAWDWCKIINTIPYEILCNLSKRVPRIYKS